MKHLMIIAGWMLLLFVPMSSALHIDESVNEVLLLGVDCNGQLHVPLVESQFNLSENLLQTLWDAKDLLLDFSPCGYLDHNCSSNFLFKIKNEEVFTIQIQLMRCPNKTRPAVSIVCIGDACSKLMIPCETSTDCGPHLTCRQKHPLATSAYFSQLTSEVVSKVLYPQHRPTSEWQFCGLTSNTSITRSNHRQSQNLVLNRNDIPHFGSNADDSLSNTKIFELSCKGGVDLFGRRHFIGILPRAVRIVQTIPLESFGFNTNSSLIQYWIEYAGFSVLPRNEFADMINILGLNITTEHSQSGKQWTVHSRAIDGALTIEVNPCATEDNALVTISAPSSHLDLLSVRSCAKHIDCPSARCIPIRNVVRILTLMLLFPVNIRERDLRTLFLLDPTHTGICQLGNWDQFLNELSRLLYKMNRPKDSQRGTDKFIKHENELYRQLHQRTFIDFFFDYIPDFALLFFSLLYLIGRAFTVTLLLPFLSTLPLSCLITCIIYLTFFVIEKIV